MDHNLLNQNNIQKGHTRKKRWRKVLGVLSGIVVSFTTYALILPGITATAPTYCGLEEHTHTDECYELRLICTEAERPAVEAVEADPGHTHGDACYAEAVTLICTETEREAVEAVEADPGHTHGDACYAEVVTLICTETEREAVEAVEADPGHTHSDECYAEVVTYTCTEADPGHVHSDECTSIERELICGEEERPAVEAVEADPGHVHTEACRLSTVELTCTETERPAVEAVEADPGHTHSEACYEKVLVCEKEEHVHEELCFSDANDKETREQWEATMPLMELDGIWAEDLLAVAESQLGVGESQKNFILENGARKGYTRFGDWYGIPYGDWCAMYVSYCLHYAGIPTSAVPRDSLTGNWAARLDALGMYRPVVHLTDEQLAELEEAGLEPEPNYVPVPGDLVFFDVHHDGRASHVGIVKEVREAEGEESAKLIAIEGNNGLTVGYFTYELNGPDIHGYGVLPANPGHQHTEDCYHHEFVLVCTEPEREPVEAVEADPGHAHSDACYTESVSYVCGEEEREATEDDPGHVHTDACIETVRELACGEEEREPVEAVEGDPGHTHGDACYEDHAELICGLQEGQILPPHRPVETPDVEQSLLFEGEDFEIEVYYRAAAGIPEGAWLAVEEIHQESEAYAEHEAAASEQLAEDQRLTYARFFDIKIMSAEGEEVTIADEVSVRVDIRLMEKPAHGEDDNISVVHFADEGAELIEPDETTVNDDSELEAVSFTANGFSVWGVVQTKTLTAQVLTAGGERVTITVSAPAEAEIPDGATLEAVELLEGSEAYAEHLAQAVEMIGSDDKPVELVFARFFDLTIRDAAGEKLEPKAPVSVEFSYEDDLAIEQGQEMVAVHFAEAGTELIETQLQSATDENGAETEGTVVTYTQESFSVTGTVVYSEIVTEYLAADGNLYKITVTFTEDAQIPAGATLALTEYEEGSEEYNAVSPLHRQARPADLESRIEARVEEMMAQQTQSKELMMSNGDFSEEDFELLSREELRRIAEAEFAARGILPANDSLSLIDITILDADGNEIEPQAPVTVEIVRETLPEGVTGGGMKNSLHVEHYRETADGLSPETVALANAGIGEIWVDGEDVTTVTFTTDSFSFYTLAWNQHDAGLDLDVMRLTVYYGFMIKDKFREFGPMRWVKAQYAEENTTGTGDLLNGKDHVYELNKSGWVSGMAAYSDYTFHKVVVQQDGYNGGRLLEVANTRTVALKSGGEITYTDPVIIGNQDDGYTVRLTDGTDYRLGNADMIRVLYNSPYGEGMDYNYAKTSTPQKPVYGGDTYGLTQDGEFKPLDEPKHSKTLSDNVSRETNEPDNTYRLSLTATGERNLTKENTKVDIILITDYSGSMGTNNEAGKKKLDGAVREGLLPPLRALEEKYGAGTVEISHIPFATTVNTNDIIHNRPLSQYTFRSWWDGATNYEDALNKLGQIRTRSDAKQYVIFITDGNPTVRNSKGEINDWTGESDIYAHGYTSDEYFWTYRHGKWQWVRIGDIEKDHSQNWYNNGYYYGSGNEATGSMRDCYNVTIPYVQQLVQNKVNFNVIATLPGATYARKMVEVGNEAVSGSSHFYLSQNKEAIKEAFTDILSSMEKELAYKFVSIDDEMSAVAETTLVETPEDFEYFKYPSHVSFVNNMTDKTPDTHSDAWAVDGEGNALDADGNKCSESGNPQARRSDFRWAEAPAAVYVPATEDEKGSVSWPLNTVEVQNETYEVTFTVYPNQAGWGMITLLANHAADPDFNWESVSAEKVTNPDGSVDIYELIWDTTAQEYVRSKKKLLSVDASGNVKIASNDDATLTYQSVERRIVDGVETVNTSDPEKAHYSSPYMSVDPSRFTVRKIWKDSLVPRWPIDAVDLELWYVSKGDVPVGDGWWKDSDTGDHTDRSEIAFVDDQGVTWYWVSQDESMTLRQSRDLKGYINIHETDESYGAGGGYSSGKTLLTSNEFESLRTFLDDENYLIDGSGNRRTNANGKLIQYFPYWETEVAIAPGLVATNIDPNGNPLPGARGHFYALREQDSDGNTGKRFVQHFELTTDVVRPMKVDGRMEAAGSMLRGINARKGELAVTKMVLTQDRHEINPDVPFQVTITLTDRNGAPLQMDVSDGVDEFGQPIYRQIVRNDIEYLVYDAGGNIVYPDSITGSKQGSYQIALSREDIDNGEAAPIEAYKPLPYDSASGQHKLVFSTLYADWTVVLVNLPTDAKWTVQETYNENTYSNGYIFEGYTLPNEGRGHDTLHPQPHFEMQRTHYSGGTVAYYEDGTVNEANLDTITDYDEDAFHLRDDKGNLVAAANGSAARAISGFVSADAEELVDIHNTRTADDLKIKKVDETTQRPLQGAKFVLESLRPETEWIWHQDVDDNGQTVGSPYWAERYVFGNNGDDPNMTNVKGPAHYPATIHIHGQTRYIVRGDVIGVLYAKPRSEWTDPYTPIPLDRDGNEIENVQWVQVPAGTDMSNMVSGRDYISQGGVSYILRRSTSEAGRFEKIPDTTRTHVYYYVESGADGDLRDTDPNHADKVRELPIIAGDATIYDMYEIEAPDGYMTVLEQLRETNRNATWDDAKFEIRVTADRMWSATQNKSVPYVEYTDPRTGNRVKVEGTWDTTNMHWDFGIAIADRRGSSDVKLKKISSTTEVVLNAGPNGGINHTETPGLQGAKFNLYRQVNDSTNTPADDKGNNLEFYYNTLASSVVTHLGIGTVLGGQRGYGATKIYPWRYNALLTDTDDGTLKLDAEGYLINTQNGERLTNSLGELVLYKPLLKSNGVEFVLAVNKEGQLLENLETNISGVIDFGRLPFGTYWLFEKEPPAGFALGKPTKIIVDRNGVRYQNQGQDANRVTDAIVSVDGNDTTYEIVVKNTSGVELPNTGGFGTHWFTAAGAALMLGALALLIKQKRRKEVVQTE